MSTNRAPRHQENEGTPWYGYFELYLFGAIWVGAPLLHLTAALGRYSQAIKVLGVAASLGLAILLPALMIMAFERLRRAVFRRFVHRTAHEDAEDAPEEEPLELSYASLLAAGIRRVKHIPYERALGGALLTRVFISMLIGVPLLATLAVHAIKTNIHPVVNIAFLTVALGVIPWAVFGMNLAIAYGMTSATDTAAHVVRGRATLRERRRKVRSSELAGAVSLDTGEGGGELTEVTSARGGLEQAHSGYSEQVALDFDTERDDIEAHVPHTHRIDEG